MDKVKDVENRVRDRAAEIFSHMKEDIPSVFDTRRWMGEVMEWAMKDEDFKVQLLRFVDVLPSLKSDVLVVRLLKEYFADEVITPMIMKWGIKGITGRGILPKIAGSLIRSNVESLARHFIAGRNPEEALTALQILRREGIAFTVDLLGEVVVSNREADEYTSRYLDLLDFLNGKTSDWEKVPFLDSDSNGPIPKVNISLKVSSFYSQLDPVDWDFSTEKTKEGLRPVFKKAKELGASITFDMEHYYYKDLTIAIFKSILEEFKDFTDAGIALQTYLKDTKEDLMDLIAWTEKRGYPITVRLVKGAYWDYEAAVNRQKGWPLPIFSNKEETDCAYEELTKVLLESAALVRPAFATHNIRSISHALALADSLNLPLNAYEFQMLYGMAEPVRRALQKMAYRVRVYATVGDLIPGMAYLVRRLLENTSNESFLRKSFVERIPFDELLKPPRRRREKIMEKPAAENFVNEAPTDFSKSENRVKMKQALKRIKKEFNKKYPLFIAGKEVSTEKETQSINPARPEEIVGTVSLASGNEAERAVAEARKAWSTWKNTTPKDRAGYLFRTAEELGKRRFELAALEVYEVGKTWKEADADVVEAIDYLKYYGKEITRLGTSRRLGNFPGEYNEYLYEPKGIGVVISPWNFPLAIGAGMVSAGIVTGNCVIFKPSGHSPVTGWKLIEAFRHAGLPPGVLHFLPGTGEEVGEYLVSHSDIDFIAFTGSRDVGLRIVKLAGEVKQGQRNVKRVIAEMGGKNAIIIDDTADLDESVKGVLESALGYQGQKCSACSRVIVVGDLYDRFCERLKGAMESIKIGPPEDPSNFMGPVVDKGAFKKIRHYIDIGKNEADVILIRKVEGEGYFIGPVIFTDVDPDSMIAEDEIFGPVLAVMRAGNIDEAIDMANNTMYALTGGIFSRSPVNIMRARKEMRVGNLYINRTITGALVGRQPFGGFGMSGVGSKAGGPDYLLQFMNPKSISENTLRKGFAPRED